MAQRRARRSRRAGVGLWVLLSLGVLGTAMQDGYAQGGGPPGGFVRVLALDPVNSNTLYAGTDGGVFKSTSGGTNWTAAGLTDSYVRALAIDPSTPSSVYAGTSGGVF